MDQLTKDWKSYAMEERARANTVTMALCSLREKLVWQSNLITSRETFDKWVLAEQASTSSDSRRG